MNQLKKAFLKSRLFHEQKGLCFYCGQPLELKDSTVDHFFPSSKGGDQHHLNKVISHKHCNQKKSNRLPTDTEMRRAASIKGVSVQYFRAISEWIERKNQW